MFEIWPTPPERTEGGVNEGSLVYKTNAMV